MLDDLYHDIVVKMVEAIDTEDTQHTKLIVIPSLTDATHDFVYPQAPNAVLDHEVRPSVCLFFWSCLLTAWGAALLCSEKGNLLPSPHLSPPSLLPGSASFSFPTPAPS